MAYHHGDLANSLADAATGLARAGGPAAIVLREAARRVGVSAASAYRHYANHDDLVAAVKERAQQELLAAMESEPVPAGRTARRRSEERLRALALGYLRFAEQEPGLFATAFDQKAPTPATSASFGLLTAALDDMVAGGALSASSRRDAETPVWALVHGLAQLLTAGAPLSRLRPDERAAAIERTLQFLTAGLA